MDKTREQLESQTPAATGIAGDMKRLHGDVATSTDELREFVAGLRGRSPQEVLGAFGESGLFQGVVQATLGCVVLLAVLSVVPWAMRADESEDTTTASAAAASAPAAATPETSDAGSATAAVAGQNSGDVPEGVNPQEAAQRMGIDETKTAKPGENPLDSKFDSLLDGLDN